MSRPKPFVLTNASLVVLLASTMAACGDTTSESGSHKAQAEGGTDASADTGLDADALDAADEPDGCPPGSDPLPDGGCSLSVRRPFLVGSSLRTAAGLEREDWTVEPDLSPVTLDRTTAHRLAATWLQDGLEEHASVAAFLRFGLHLLAVGAPPDFLVDSQRAALDELHHAKACFALARRYGTTSMGPGPLSLRDALPQLSLAELAALTAEEGCVGETLGALLAAEELAVARDPDVIRVREKIVRDETRHAALAWRFVRWAVLRDPTGVIPAVSRAIETASASTVRMEMKTYDGIDLDAWHAHGRLTCQEARALAERAIRDVIRPSAERLLGSPRDRAETTSSLSSPLLSPN